MSFYKSFGIYTVCGFLAKGISFLLLPFFTHHLSRTDYGIITVFSNSVYFIAPLMNMGIGETFTVEYPMLSKTGISDFISTSVLIPLVVLGFVGLSVATLGGFFQRLTGLPLTLQYLICLFGFSNFFGEYLFTVLRNKNQPLLFGLLAVCKTVMELALAVYFIRYCGDGYMGRVKSMFISTLVLGIISLGYFINQQLLSISFSKRWARVILTRGLPAIPLFLMMFILYNADNYMVNYYHGAAMLGPYGLACQIALLVNFVASSFITPFYPLMYDSLNKGNPLKVVVLAFRYTILISGIVLLLGFCTPLVFKFLIGYQFQGALHYLWYLLLGQLFFSMYLILAGLVFYKKHNYIYYYFSPVVIILTLGVNYYIIGVLQWRQFALASAISYFACFAGIAALYHKNIYAGAVLYWKSIKSKPVL